MKRTLITSKRFLIPACAGLAYLIIFIGLRSEDSATPAGSYIETIDGSASLAAVQAAIDHLPHTLGQKTRSSGCRVNGPLPDPACTPGAVFSVATTTDICVEGYSQTVRNVPANLKKKIYKAYGIAYPPPFGTYELDHLVNLSIGGSNDAANLFPEAASPAPGFPEKDVVENYLHQEVCNGHIGLREAQAAIASDWLKIYESLDPSDIQSLKAKFKNWAEKGGSA